MALDPYIADTARAVLNWTTPSGTSAANVWHFANFGTSPVTEAQFDDLYNEIKKLMDTYGNNDNGLLATLDSNCILNTVQITDISAAGGYQKTYTPGLPGLVGDVNPMPPNAALLVQFRTALSGRANRGRAYLPGFTESANDDAGRVASSYRTLIASIFTEFGTALSAVDWGHSIAHFRDPGPSSTTHITSYQVSIEWDHQDRRRR